MSQIATYKDRVSGHKMVARPFTLTGNPFVVTAVVDPGALGFDQALVTVSCAQGLGQVTFKADPNILDQLQNILIPDQILDAADQLYNGGF